MVTIFYLYVKGGFLLVKIYLHQVNLTESRKSVSDLKKAVELIRATGILKIEIGIQKNPILKFNLILGGQNGN